MTYKNIRSALIRSSHLGASDDINVLLRSTVHRLIYRPTNMYAMTFSMAANHIHMYSSPIFSMVLPSTQHPMQRCQAEFLAEPGSRRPTIPDGTIYVALNHIGHGQQAKDDQPNDGQHDEGTRRRPPAKRNYLQRVQRNSLSPISYIAVICCVTSIPSYYDMNLLDECFTNLPRDVPERNSDVTDLL